MRSNIIIPYRGLNTSTAYDIDTQAFFTALETDASPTFLSDAQKGYLNTRVINLKAWGLWSKAIAYYVFMGSTASAFKYNLKDPRDLDAAYRLSLVGSPAISSGGADWNGSTQYASTHIPNSLINESNFSISIYHGDNVDELAVSYGWDDSGRHGGIFTKYSGSVYSDAPTESEGRLIIGTAYDTRGMWHVSLTPTRQHTVYRNGVSIGSQTNASSAALSSAGNILLNARDLGPSFVGTKIDSWFAVYTTGLTGTEVANEYTEVNGLQTSLGRNY